MTEHLKEFIRAVPDFPKKGIMFRDITTLIGSGEKFKSVIDELVKRYEKSNIDYIVSIESRGFIFGSVLAYVLGCGFIPVRKKGKLPCDTYEVSYGLEYGTDILTIHKDAFQKGKRVLLLDDLLATGGTTRAGIELVNKLGGKIVEAVFVIELEFLKGREKIKDVPVFSLVKYDKE
ncbi:MAG: adenine phosphoribosyltransferase [Omnitrophica bacterium]|nr:adenine phosphoribosyltransferase [Candidatus Omnitrophota bacterium]